MANDELLRRMMTGGQTKKPAWQNMLTEGMSALGSGKLVGTTAKEDTEAMDSLIKYNSAITGSPEHREKIAQIEANRDFEQAKRLNEYKAEQSVEADDTARAKLRAEHDAGLPGMAPITPPTQRTPIEGVEPISSTAPTGLQSMGVEPLSGTPETQKPVPAMVQQPAQAGGDYELVPKDAPQREWSDKMGWRTKPGTQEYALTPEAEASVEGLKVSTKKGAEAEAKRVGATKMKQDSAFLILGAGKRLGDAWVKAFHEGGVGSLHGALRTQALTVLGGEAQDKYARTASTIPGLKTEIIAKIMPMLTQQGDEKGSVRLVESIFRKIEKTLPDLQTGPMTAKDMLAVTLRNMMGYAKAFEMHGKSGAEIDAMDDASYNNYINFLEQMSLQVGLSPEEEQATQEALQSTLSAFDTIGEGPQASEAGGRTVEDVLAEYRAKVGIQ